MRGSYPDEPGTIRDSAAQPLTVWRGGFTLGLSPGKAFQPRGRRVRHSLGARPHRHGNRRGVACRARHGPAAAPDDASAADAGAGIAWRADPQPDALRVSGAGAEGRRACRHAARGRARAQAAAYTAGVLVAFAALGAALLAARAAGSAAGWGFQFQSPVFVAGMAWLLFAVGLNLSGVFQVGTGLMRTGHGMATRPGQLGSFFTGLLAVVVATPCTAPFMGVAIAAGLAAPPIVTMLVFVAMGLGLAAPYALLATIPALGRATPKPGRWMEVLRQALAFPMYAASAWLVWVVSQEAGSSGVLGPRRHGAAGLCRLGAGAGARRRDRGRRIGQSAAAAALLAALAVLSGIASAPLEPLPSLAGSGAEPFTAARLAALRAEGRPVFVDMTAAWCVTCLVNERVAIDTNAVRQAFADHHVTYLKGDWTRQDPNITNYLRENGHEGVPLVCILSRRTASRRCCRKY